MVRKRVILLSITFVLVVNQFMLWQHNKAISSPNYSYTSVEDLSNCQKIFNGKCIDKVSSNTQSPKPYHTGKAIQPQGYNIDPYVAKRQAERDALDASTGVPSRNFSSGYLNAQRVAYNAHMANQAGVPYEEYICQGNFQCIQQMYMNEQQINAMNNYANAVRNQNVNINGSLDIYNNVNRNGYYNRY